eukprot:scaffold35616_cov61-Phaeocystis_antarctica.AAC.3
MSSQVLPEVLPAPITLFWLRRTVGKIPPAPAKTSGRLPADSMQGTVCRDVAGVFDGTPTTRGGSADGA